MFNLKIVLLVKSEGLREMLVSYIKCYMSVFSEEYISHHQGWRQERFFSCVIIRNKICYF